MDTSKSRIQTRNYNKVCPYLSSTTGFGHIVCILLNDNTRSQHVSCASAHSEQHLGLEPGSNSTAEKARTATAETTGCLESFHGSGAVILEASR